MAKYRCCNPESASYALYGGRGLLFEFASASAMAAWVLRNIGQPPPGGSLDRIDNARGYAAGNLRWADAATQNGNKRRYECWKHGGRIQRLADARQDLCYETIRTWITKGLTDDEILNRKKSTSGRPRVRHRKLRATKSLCGGREGGIEL